MSDDKQVENRVLREEMVKSQIISRQISDDLVIEAMKNVPRELMVRPEDYKMAFYDGPLPIGHAQTISQPYIVAYMTEALGLSGTEKVLEIGTGSGYQTAILAEICREVFTVEIVEQLASRAEESLRRLGYTNISFRTGNGREGWPEEAPFDAIMVTAAPDSVPSGLADQLADGGRMIIPVGTGIQYLKKITKQGDEFSEDTLIAVRFVPLTGGKRE
jgi:protein-L-isoaspartate(D-aspartate) O-methyltransferase